MHCVGAWFEPFEVSNDNILFQNIFMFHFINYVLFISISKIMIILSHRSIHTT